MVMISQLRLKFTACFLSLSFAVVHVIAQLCSASSGLFDAAEGNDNYHRI